MSNIYIQEPPTNGKVLLKTTVGDIDLELWSREAPKACRNFVQLCLEGYYNQTIFHRVVKNFIVQGGDPTGTGTGGESIYGAPFKDEFHSRLRFNRRGLVAMANAGQDDNASQFFFTMAAAPELQNKHTIFAKVTRETIFNVLKLQEALVDKDERPLYPQKIIKTEVLHNPFPDIVPRVLLKPDEKKDDKKKKDKRSGVKNFKLLSFGEEAEEDEEAMSEANKKYSGRSKSTHDILNDPKLSATPAVLPNQFNEDYEEESDQSVERDIETNLVNKEEDGEKLNETKTESKTRWDDENIKETEKSDIESHELASSSGNYDSGLKPKIDHEERENQRESVKRTASSHSEESDQLSGDEDSHQSPTRVSQKSMENLRKKLKGEQYASKSKNSSKNNKKEEDVPEEKSDLDKVNIRKEIKALRRELHASKNKQDGGKDEESAAGESKSKNEYIQFHQKYKNLKNQLPRKGFAREEFTMALLSKFQMRLAYAKDKVMEQSENEGLPKGEGSNADEDNDDWLTHKLKFEDHAPTLAKDASTKTDDWFEIYDPRNPINKRRREASKELMRQKDKH